MSDDIVKQRMVNAMEKNKAGGWDWRYPSPKLPSPLPAQLSLSLIAQMYF